MGQHARTWEESPNIAKWRRKQASIDNIYRWFWCDFHYVWNKPIFVIWLLWARWSPWDFEQRVGPSALGLHLTGDVSSLGRRSHTVWINSSPSNHCVSHFKAQLAQLFLINHLICTYWIKGILCGYAIRSGRHPEGSQRPPGRPAVGPAAADFPRDVCLTVSRNHKIFLFYDDVCVPQKVIGRVSYAQCAGAKPIPESMLTQSTDAYMWHWGEMS